MKPQIIVSAAGALLKAKLFGVRTPLAVSFDITARCNQSCGYCGIWKQGIPEISTSDAIRLLEDLRRLGTCWVSFTGGEPLLRDDLGELIAYAKAKKFYVSVSSNGALVPRKIGQLKAVDDLKLSLDGSPDVHNKLRAEGSYDKVITAIQCCQENGVKPSLQCVLSAQNLDSIDHVLEIARKWDCTVLFQPATQKLLWSDEANDLSPEIEPYRQAILGLMDAKRKGAPIRNSLSGLKHIYHWPKPTKMACSAGLLNCELLPDGSVLGCSRFDNGQRPGLHKDIASDIRELPVYAHCDHCWSCALVEFNLIASFDVGALINCLKNF